MSALHSSLARHDPRERFARQFFRVVNPLALRMMSVGIPTGSRNILLTVPGRRSGKLRTTCSCLRYSANTSKRRIRFAGLMVMSFDYA